MLFHTLTKTARAFPGKTALVLGSRRLRYDELLGRVEHFMNRLRLLNVGEGDCIALVLPNSVAFVVSFYALAGVRAIALPLNPTLKADELRYYLADNEIRVLITDSERAVLCRHTVKELGKDISLVIIEESGDAATPPSQSASSDNLDASRVPFDGPGMYQYSSGSTGRAKKVCRTQKNLY